MALEQPQLPCGVDGACMRCKVEVPSEECLTCNTCGSLWHASCLKSSPESLASTQQWECPDCSGVDDPVPNSGISSDGSVLVTEIRAIQADASLTEAQKAKKKQLLMSGKAHEEEDEEKNNKGEERDDVLTSVRDNLTCAICIQLLERPVSTPCGHNFCLKCFEKWVVKGNRTCVKCRTKIPIKMARNPRVNLCLVNTIRNSRVSKTPKAYHHISNPDRPEKAFTTERAKLHGKANACSGRRFVTAPSDHFGPITAEYDPTRNQGVQVGDTWDDRTDCKQWGVHNLQVAGIAGQSGYGAQSVALSGGYEDDEDHGEWILYTGCGGRDLKGNKRTNKEQSFDQTFERSNQALRISCEMGYPVRVVRSHMEKCLAYAPVKGVRYDGIYRVEKCWRNVGLQGFKVCRYLLVRCDNDPAPWTSDEHGDRPRPLPNLPVLKEVTDFFVRTESPSWDFDETDGRWKWMKSPPASRVAVNALDSEERKVRKQNKIMKGFGCQICRKVMSFPVTTPCGHYFCKLCLENKFAGISQVREISRGGRALRPRKNVMSCPCCKDDISDFVQNPQVNREMMCLIEDLNKKEDEAVVEKEEEEEKEEEDEEEEEEDEAVVEKEEEEEDEAVVEKEEEEEDEAVVEKEEEEEETQTVADEDEPPTKKMKLDTVALSA